MPKKKDRFKTTRITIKQLLLTSPESIQNYREHIMYLACKEAADFRQKFFNIDCLLSRNDSPVGEAERLNCRHTDQKPNLFVPANVD